MREKKNRNKPNEPKKKWSIWKTIVVVFAAFVLVVGVVIGGIYLGGGLRNKKVKPTSLRFEVNEFYNSATEQFEVTDSFSMTVLAGEEDEGVTELDVELTLSDALNPNSETTLNNKIISIPRYVKIGVPFPVTVVRSSLNIKDEKEGFDPDEFGLTMDTQGRVVEKQADSEGQLVDKVVNWITGGRSTIVARSTSDKVRPIESQPVTVAVDRPVYRTNVKLLNGAGQELVKEVVGQGEEKEINYSVTRGDRIKAVTEFFPADSQFLYSDNLAQIPVSREKVSFFEPVGTTGLVSLFGTDMTFVAESNSKNTIQGHVYQDALKQYQVFTDIFGKRKEDEDYQDFIEQLDVYFRTRDFSALSAWSSVSGVDNEETLYRRFFDRLPTTSSSLMSQVNLEILDATVVGFNITPNFSQIYTERKYTLYMNGVDPSTLNGISLGARVASSLQGGTIDSMLENIGIAIEYDVDGVWRNIDELGDISPIQIGARETRSINGVTYYLPNRAINPNFASFELYTVEKYSFKMTVVLIESKQNGYEIFASREIYFSSERNPDAEVRWTETEKNLTLSTNAGDSVPQTEPLKFSELTYVPENNNYKTKIFFAYFGTNNVAEADRLANTILGEGAYLKENVGEYSGYRLYPLTSRTELVAIGTGDFDLYFATVLTKPGESGDEYVYNGNLFEFSKITESPMHIHIKRALYKDSVTGLTVALKNENRAGEAIYLHTSAQAQITLTFVINPDSVEELEQKLLAYPRKIELELIGTGSQVELSEYLSIAEPQLNKHANTLTYVLTLEDKKIDGDIELNSVKLYEVGTDNEWSFAVKYDNLNIYLYTPSVDSISFGFKEGVGTDQPIKVKQSLTSNGTYQIEMNGTLIESINDWIDKNLSIIVYDQHGNTRVFENEWQFTTTAPTVLMLVGNKQTFAFGNAENAIVSLSVSCKGVRALTSITFDVTSIDIQRIDYTSDQEIDGQNTQDKTVTSDMIGASDIIVSKYAVKGKTITLKDLIKIFADADGQVEITNYTFNLKASALYSLDDKSLIDLFGENGMLTLRNRQGNIAVARNDLDDSEYAVQLRATLGGIEVSSIVTNEEFGHASALSNWAEEIEFEIRIGARSLDFTLSMLASATLSTDASSDITGYAQVGLEASGSVNHHDGESEKITQLVERYNNYYITLAATDGETEEFYTLKNTNEGTTVGQIKNGKFVFDDIWVEEPVTYKIRFSLANKENNYTLTHEITFTILRNIMLRSKDQTFKLFDGSNQLSDFFEIKRIEGEDIATDISVLIETSGSLGLTSNTTTTALATNLSPNQNNLPLFTYGQSMLSQTFVFRISDNSKVFNLGTLTLNYELGIDLATFAARITKGSLAARVQTINGLEYIFVTTGDYTFTSTGNDFNFTILRSMQTYTGDYDLLGQNVVTFNNSSNYFISGLYNNSNALIVRFRSPSSSGNGTDMATAIIPLLTSEIGQDVIKFTSSHNMQNLLQYATTNRPKDLISEGAFETVSAGNNYNVVGGAFGFNVASTSATSDIHAVGVYDKNGDEIEGLNLVSLINGDSIYLNHLAQQYPDGVYLLLQLQLERRPKSFALYYMVKVTPDVETSITYPYDSNREYILRDDEAEIYRDLDEAFGETAKNSGSRFSISKGGRDLELLYSYDVASVEGEGITDWRAYLDITFTNASEKDTHKSRMTITFKTNNTAIFTIKIKRVYGGGVVNAETQNYAVVGDDVTYTFVVIRSDQNYVLRYSGDDLSQQEFNNATWTVSAAQTRGSIKLELYRSDNITSIPTDGNLNYVIDAAHKSEYNSLINFTNGNLTITRPSFVKEDTNIQLYFYTEYGLTGTLTIIVKANISAQISTDAKEAGTYGLSDFVTNIKNGNSVIHPQIVSAYQKDEQGGRLDSAKAIFLCSGQSITIYPTAQSKTISVAITVNVDENAAHYTTFNITFTVNAGIDNKQEYDVSNNENANVFGGETTKILDENGAESIESLYDFEHGSPSAVKYTWTSLTGNLIKTQTDKQDSINIGTNSVNEDTEATAVITVYLYNQTPQGPEFDNFYDRFTVRYTFKIVPSTQIVLNYPDPDNNGNMDDSGEFIDDELYEYLENGYTVSSTLGSFLDGTADFASGPRVHMYSESDSKNWGLSNSTGHKVKVTIVGIQNMVIYTGDSSVYTDYNESNNVVFDTDGAQPTNLHFAIGTRLADGSIQNVDFTESYVYFQIECEGAIAVYRVILQDRVFDMELNRATDNTSQSVETFYVDDLTAEDAKQIFAPNRMLKFTTLNTSGNGNVIGATYRWVFEKKDEERSTYKVVELRKLGQADVGRTLTFDLGTSLEGYQYVGTYLLSDLKFDNGDLNTEDFEQVSVKENRKQDSLLYSITPQLVGRAELIYIMGNRRVTVDSSYISNLENEELTFTQEDVQNKTINEISTFAFGGIKTFSQTYSYKVEIDIQVGKQGPSHTTFITAGEIKSLITENDIWHPSSGDAHDMLTAQELSQNNKTINLEIVGINNLSVPQEFSDILGGDYKPYNDNINNRYLSLSVNDVSGKIQDFRITGRGAHVGGNYVLLKFTYTVIVSGTSYSQESYLLYKVMPNYIIKFEGLSQIDTSTVEVDEELIAGEIQISNSEKIAEFTPNNAMKYNQIVVAGNDAGVVKITRKNSDTNVAATGFKYTMTVNDIGLDRLYNVENNINQKFAPGTNNFKEDEGWTNDITHYYYQNAIDGSLLQFSDVVEVISSPQYYRLTAVDNFGFEFCVYFMLRTTRIPPTANESELQITEGDKFDLAATYVQLTIAESSSDPTKITVNQSAPPIAGTSAYKVFTINDLQAWGFAQNVDGKNSSVSDYLDWNGASYSGGANKGEHLDINYELTNPNLEYLSEGDFYRLTISKIEFKDKDGNSLQTSIEGGEKLLATSSGLRFNNWAYWENEDEHSEGIEDVNDAIFFGPSERFTMPELDAEMYHDDNPVHLSMMVTLKYHSSYSIEDGKVKKPGDGEADPCEEFIIPIPIRVSSNASFASRGVYVRDGEEFNISDAIAASVKHGDVTGVTYYNDTLEVTLPESSTLSLNIISNGNSYPVEIYNRASYTSTQYISISNTIERTIKTGDAFTLSISSSSSKRLYINQEESADFYGFYIKYKSDTATKVWFKDYEGQVKYGDAATKSGGTGTEAEANDYKFTIGQITKDRISYISAQEMPDPQANADLDRVIKYYVATVTTDSRASQTVGPYEFAQEYIVTANYSSFSTNYGLSQYKTVDQYVQVENGHGTGVHAYVVPVQGWTQGMTLNIAENQNGSAGRPVQVAWDSFNENTKDKFDFEINEDESSSGAANINKTTGVITTTKDFNIDSHYIVVNIYLKASGLFGDFSTMSIANNRKLIGAVDFQLKAPGNALETVGTTSSSNNVLRIQNSGYRDGQLALVTESMKFETGKTLKALKINVKILKGMTNQYGNIKIGSTSIRTQTQYRFDKNSTVLYLKNTDILTAGDTPYNDTNAKLSHDFIYSGNPLQNYVGDNTFYIPYQEGDVVYYLKMVVSQYKIGAENYSDYEKFSQALETQGDGAEFTITLSGNSVKQENVFVRDSQDGDVVSIADSNTAWSWKSEDNNTYSYVGNFGYKLTSSQQAGDVYTEIKIGVKA